MERKEIITKRRSIICNVKVIIVIILVLSIIFGEGTLQVNAAQKKNQGITYYSIESRGHREYTSKSITIYAPFVKGNKPQLRPGEGTKITYGKKKFILTAKTKYYGNDDIGPFPVPKKKFLEIFKRSGFHFVIKVKNGKVISINQYM